MKEQKYVYESPDGGHTIYRRRVGDDYTQRQLHSISPEKKSLLEDLQESKLWENIRRLSKEDPALKHMLDQIEIYYRMKYDTAS